jgi:hypothetical protein
MPIDLLGAAGASDGTYFYAAGGYSFSQGNTLAVFNRYDPVANSWTSLPDMPQAAIMPVAVYYPGPPEARIYVFGGEDFVSGTNYNITRIYHIATNNWTTGANMPDVRSFSAGGYIPGNGKIYIISGYSTENPGSAQPNTWEYDPVADSWTDLTGSAPFPHPAGGFAFGVINDKLYISGGHLAGYLNITWEYDPVANSYTQKADMPANQPTDLGSAVALDALFVFGGGDPFLAPGASAAKTLSHSSKATVVRNFSPASIKGKPLLPATSNATYVYDPANDQWTTSANMNENRSFASGAFISGSNEIIGAGGYNGVTTVASAEVLTPCIPTPTPCSPTPTPPPGCGLVIGDGLTIGFEPNVLTTLANNIVNYTFSKSQTAPNDFALFETHDPWGYQIIKNAITGNGHTYSEFTPAQLAGFDFSQYRVVILNWDDTYTSDFLTQYTEAIASLEAYAAAGGVVWVQGAIQGIQGVSFYPLPFGGTSILDVGFFDPIVNACSPMVIGVPNPIEGNSASLVSDTGLPVSARVVVVNGYDENPVLYDLLCATPTPPPTPTPPQCDTGLITNEGFETGDFTGWTVQDTSGPPVVTNTPVHSGNFSAFVGDAADGYCGYPCQSCEVNGDSSFYQEFGPVPANATLSFWHWDCTTDDFFFDWQDAYITDTNGNILEAIFHHCFDNEAWVNTTVSLAPYAGQTIRVKFLVHEDGFGNLTGMYVDDVQVTVPCGSPTPTPTPTATPTPTPTPSGITLTAHGRRVQGRHTVDLTWSPVTSANIDIYRDGVVIATVPNTGAYKDFIGVRGGNVRYTYKVCDAGTSNCSNEVIVRFGGPPR